MEVIGFSRETELAFSEREMEVAEQLVQLSEDDDTLSCCSGTNWNVSEGGSNTKRREDVSSSEIRDMVGKDRTDVRMMHKNVTDGQSFVKTIRETNIIRRNKKKKFKSIVSIYRATNRRR
ncbi:hypothetical protein Bca52824_012256 [Brassica carinata]|uniref:Uncharacterized protein n=1 Tax=Brassica carinata TaxID=52824 RepID=A0A8X8B276_BRACI|nr:hypothetical protein Bca52824_012256 [Brassica carinata]